jgi:hypothetical protein
MASLIVHSSEPKQAAFLSKRALIGRKSFNGVQFGQRVVSRIHAWIDKDGESFYIRDSASRGGTFVNGKLIGGKVTLHDGDQIQIGPSTLTFHLTDELPAGTITFNIAEDGSNPDFENPGILMACSCGAPLWVPRSMAGAFGKCGICKGDITVPGTPPSGIRRPLTPNDSIVDVPALKEPVNLGASARPRDPLAVDFPRPKPAATEEETCSICQSPILTGEVITSCPTCSQNYHMECWLANQGCAAYGCAHVGAEPEPMELGQLVTQGLPQTPEPAASAPAEDLVAQPAFPWDFALLGGSVAGSILGAFTFGVPALAVGTASAVYAIRNGAGRNRVAALSAVICLFGVAFGVVASRFWWFNVPPWGGR